MVSATQRKNLEKIKWARISIWSNTALTVLKLVVGLAMFSVSVLSEAIHSGMDLLAAVIANVAVMISARPPDKEHAYGHGKYENLSAVAEAILIFIAAAIIIIESIRKILDPAEIGYLNAGIAVMGISALVNIAVSRKLWKVARATESAALEADALHLSTDVWTSVGVMLGLVLIRFTGLQILDPLIAIVVALGVIHAGWELVRRSARDLADTSLPEPELEKIRLVVARHRDRYVEFHGLRARRAGAQRHIDLHLVLARDTHVEDAHDLCDLVEKEIEKDIDGSEVMVHIEPCARRCELCATRPGCKAAMEDSLSGGLAEGDWKVISRALERHRGSFAGYGNLRMRREGKLRRLKLELEVARHASIDRLHELTGRLTSELQEGLDGTVVNLQLKPCKVPCSDCERQESCDARGPD